MIRVKNMNIEEDKALGLRRLSFPLKVSRNVWLTDDKLVLEYPLKFENLRNIGEAVVFSLLPIAFREASHIELPPDLSIEEGTQDRIDKICSLWNSWYSCNRKVKILVNRTKPELLNGNKRCTAVLFSGGVDSLTTFKRHRDRIKYLVLYRGTDVAYSQKESFEKVKKYMQEFAQEQKKELITLSTNVRYLGTASWVKMAISCGPLAPLLALSNYIDRIYISSSYPFRYQDKFPSGSHRDIDPLVSLDCLDVIHDGGELKRPEKIAFIASEPALLKRLRVCNNSAYLEDNNRNGNRFNCGNCEKCYRTCLVLYFLGISPEQVPFTQQSLSLHNIANYLKTHKMRFGLKFEWLENYEFIESLPSKTKEEEDLKSILWKFVGDIYEDYKKGFPNGAPVEYVSKWRRLEKKLGLKMESLEGLKKFLRFFRGSAYKEFVRHDGLLTKA